MTSEQFVTAQSAIEQAAAPLWERWTIDEIDEGVARVLITRAANTTQLREIASLVIDDRSSPGATRRIAALLRTAAMRAELDHATEQWSAEAYGYAPLSSLERFLRGRGGKPGLPTNRPLREGDVFWVLVADWPAPSEQLSDMTASELEAHVAELQRANADVWDVTAAARQAAKRSYHEVVRKTSEDDQVHAEAEHG